MNIPTESNDNVAKTTTPPVYNHFFLFVGNQNIYNTKRHNARTTKAVISIIDTFISVVPLSVFLNININKGSNKGIEFASITDAAKIDTTLFFAFECTRRLYATKSNIARIKAKVTVAYLSIFLKLV